MGIATEATTDLKAARAFLQERERQRYRQREDLRQI
jgi:hypothetical protein